MSYGGFSVFWGRCPGCRSLLVLAVVSTYGCVRRLLVLAILSTYVYTGNCIKLRLFQSMVVSTMDVSIYGCINYGCFNLWVSTSTPKKEIVHVNVFTKSRFFFQIQSHRSSTLYQSQFQPTSNLVFGKPPQFLDYTYSPQSLPYHYYHHNSDFYLGIAQIHQILSPMRLLPQHEKFFLGH